MTVAGIIAQLKPRMADLRAKAGPLARRFWKELVGIGVLLLVLAGPFLLRPAGATGPTHYDRRLVILTPHHESIRQEFGHAFTQFWKQKTGETVFVDWRVPGGTSDIAMLLKSEYTAAFQNLWEGKQGQDWSSVAAQSCLDGKLDLSADADGKFTVGQQARKSFLDSTVGIGVDLFFGGGAYDFQSQARNGILVSSPPEQEAGLPKVAKDHPEWFSDAGIPEQVSGEPFRDKDGRWCGTCLSSFGIVFNRDVLRRLGVEKDPEQWEDLADPRLAGQIALADPGRSGSVAKAFEMLIQQQMQQALVRLTKEPGKLKTPEAIEAAAVRLGWREGLKLIQRISANARYFADSSTKIPLEVARGDAAAGMCIDYFGRASAESLQRLYGKSRVGFVMPEGGTSIGVDPIGMLRGAKEPELATAFMDFVLSERGQNLWSYRAGIPGGPKSLALRR
ncbi:MAG: extracellular solute-binding protein, partial [Verrucomicrobiales bacterium]|nr:extracellular solute-binding protein [Verrucomicrobiales bacterium]